MRHVGNTLDEMRYDRAILDVVVVVKRETDRSGFWPVSAKQSLSFALLLGPPSTLFSTKIRLNFGDISDNHSVSSVKQTTTLTALCYSGFVQWSCLKKAMLVTVFCAPRDRPETTFALDVSPDLELRDFVALCELESGIPAGEIQVKTRASCSRTANAANS